MLEVCSDQQALALDMIQFLMVRIIYNLSMVNTLPCMCTFALSLGLRVDDWLHSLAYIKKDSGYIYSIEKSCANDGENSEDKNCVNSTNSI